MTLNRPAQGWLLISQLGIALPLTPHTPPWTLGIFALCLLWRIGIYLGRVARPPRSLINLLGIGALLTLMGVVESMGTLSALINLLLLAYALKAVESRTRADLTVVVITGYFLIGMQLIQHFNPAIALQLILLTVLNTTPLLAQYRPEPPLAVARHAILLILVSLPLALLLFLVVPRLDPIWQIQSPALARTGLSESLVLGDLAKLSRDDRLVLRARFDGPPPPPSGRYWRALVLDHYDGERWQGSTAALPAPHSATGPVTETWQRYQMQLEPGPNLWLPALRGSISKDPSIVPLGDQLLRWRAPRHSRTVATLWWPGPRDTTSRLTASARERMLQLPEGRGERSRAWAQSLTRRYPEPADRLEAILTPFAQPPFRYTLSPPPLGPDPIDGFLFDQKAGFCAHYASALVFMARAAGLPARLITGYQGGELSPNGEVLSLYQYNAHAWAEVHLEGEGWRRVDPTALVAPERIEQGPQAALDAMEEGVGDRHWLTGASAWSGRIQGWLSQLDYQWSQWVMGFDEGEQRAFWQSWLGGLSLMKAASIILSGLLLLALGQFGTTLWQQRSPPAQMPVRLYRQTLKRLERLNAGIRPGEGPLTHLARLRRCHPELAQALAPVCQGFVSLRYEPDAQGQRQRLKQFRHQRRQLHRLIRRLMPVQAGPE